MQAFGFEVGDSNYGPISFSAEINAETEMEALAQLQHSLPRVGCRLRLGDVGDVRVYFNPRAISLGDLVREQDDAEGDTPPAAEKAALAAVPPAD